MQSLNKVAGVQDPQPSSWPEPPPIPETEQDIEAQTNQSIRSRPSRSSLPPNRQPSRRTLNTRSSRPSLREPDHLAPPGSYSASRRSGESSHVGSEDEIAWGPQHPCFPHPNPHVPLSSLEYTTTRVIRVQRDWLVAGDLYPALQNLYPEILLGYVGEDEFRVIVETLNQMLKEAFDPWSASSWVDSALGVATGFLWDNMGLTATKRKVAKIEQWLDQWNREARRQGKEAVLISPRKTGFMSLDIQIPDPLIDEPILADADSRAAAHAHP